MLIRVESLQQTRNPYLLLLLLLFILLVMLSLLAKQLHLKWFHLAT